MCCISREKEDREERESEMRERGEGGWRGKFDITSLFLFIIFLKIGISKVLIFVSLLCYSFA
jgi:hypothetical protein